MSTNPPPPPSIARSLPRPIDGLSDIADDYATFFVDLWGVVHNGIAPFPGVVECLTALMAAGKKVCLLTNAPRRAVGNIARLESMGVPHSCFTTLVSSGEATHHALSERTDPFLRSLGRRCFHLGPVRDCDVHEGLDLELVSAPEAASFMLMTGIDRYDETLEDHLDVLRRARAVDLPILCANPDLIVVVGDREAICAGVLAQAYAEMGGTVGYIGKPHVSVYDFALAAMNHAEGERVVCIGDGFHTDITGAARAGFDSVFVSGGIHADELHGGAPTSPAIADLIDRYNVEPVYAIKSLAW